MNKFLSKFNDIDFGKAILIKMLRDRKKINILNIYKRLFYVFLFLSLILLILYFNNLNKQAINQCVSGGLSKEVCERALN